MRASAETVLEQTSLPRWASTDHPRLFITKPELKAAAGRVKQFPWAAEMLNQITGDADRAVDEKLEIPDKPAQWTQHFVCSDCGIYLKEDAGRNICPRCGREYSGWPYDEVLAGRKHIDLFEKARVLGLAWQLTAKESYAAKCREILLGYADKYQDYPIHDYQGGQSIKGGKLYAQTLDESVRMITLVWAYDLVYNSPAMTEEDRAHIENDLFRPAAQVIMRNDMSISNWQSWHNAAIAAIGFTLGDERLVDHAINGKSGIHFQMDKSILKDGFWYEGTASYHFYALLALQWQAQAMKSAGMKLYQKPVFRSLYEAPSSYVFPDGRFPAVNDSDPVSIDSQHEYYEMAYAWYGDPKFGMIAKAGKRRSLNAFLWGKDELPSGLKSKPESSIFPGIGAVMLQQNTGRNPLALHLDYGPHGGAHGHPDKLGIIFFANGRDAMPDAGRLAYGAPLHNRWYKTTVAHNTVIVDGKNQKQAEARLISSSLDGEIKLATAICDTAYKDVTLTRSVALTPQYLLDVVSGKSAASHTWDLAYHVQGAPETDLILKPVDLPEKKNGYRVLKNVRQAAAPAGGWRSTFNGTKTGDRLDLIQADTGKADVIFADGLVGNNVTTCPVVLTRQKGDAPVWISLVVPGNTDDLEWECKPTEGGWIVTVSVGDQRTRYRIEHGAITETSSGS